MWGRTPVAKVTFVSGSAVQSIVPKFFSIVTCDFQPSSGPSLQITSTVVSTGPGCVIGSNTSTNVSTMTTLRTVGGSTSSTSTTSTANTTSLTTSSKTGECGFGSADLQRYWHEPGPNFRFLCSCCVRSNSRDAEHAEQPDVAVRATRRSPEPADLRYQGFSPGLGHGGQCGHERGGHRSVPPGAHDAGGAGGQRHDGADAGTALADDKCLHSGGTAPRLTW